MGKVISMRDALRQQEAENLRSREMQIVELKLEIENAAYRHVQYCANLDRPDDADMSAAAIIRRHETATKACRSLMLVTDAQQRLAEFQNQGRVLLWDEGDEECRR